MIANIQTIDFPVLGDERGKLIALEALTEQIPFDVKRVYYIVDHVKRIEIAIVCKIEHDF